MFHSDVPIRLFWKILNNAAYKCFSAKNFLKKIFLVIRGFPEIDKNENFWFFQIYRKCPKTDFKTKMGWFGSKMNKHWGHEVR